MRAASRGGPKAAKKSIPGIVATPHDGWQYVIAAHRAFSAGQSSLSLRLAVRPNLEHSSRHQRLGDSNGIVPGTDFCFPYFRQDEVFRPTIVSGSPESGPIDCRPQGIIIGILLSVTPAGKAAFPMQLGSE